MTGGKPTIDQLVARFVETEIREAEAIEHGDMKKQNRWADRIDSIMKDLLSRGDEGRSALERLMHHELPLVRVSAASQVLRWAPERAIPTLAELLAWAYFERNARGRRPAIAGFILHDAKGLLSEHYNISISDVVPRFLGVKEERRPWM